MKTNVFEPTTKMGRGVPGAEVDENEKPKGGGGGGCGGGLIGAILCLVKKVVKHVAKVAHGIFILPPKENV